MKIGKIDIKASRWPWQKGNYAAPLNPAGARFGGGWKYRFGVDVGSTTVMLNLIWGMVRISWKSNAK